MLHVSNHQPIERPCMRSILGRLWCHPTFNLSILVTEKGVPFRKVWNFLYMSKVQIYSSASHDLLEKMHLYLFFCRHAEQDTSRFSFWRSQPLEEIGSSRSLDCWVNHKLPWNKYSLMKTFCCRNTSGYLSAFCLLLYAHTKPILQNQSYST